MEPTNSHKGLKSLVKIKTSEHKGAAQPWIAKRYVVAILIFSGNVCMQLLQGNLNIAIVAMTSNNVSLDLGNGTIIYDSEYHWNSQLKGFIISLFPYGFVVSLLGGTVITKYGLKGATVYGLGITLSAFLAMLTPFILRANFYAFLVCRVMQGFLQGFSYSSVFEVWLRWAPVEERSQLLAVGLSGQTFGIAVTYPFCGFLAYKWGWPGAFYGTGFLSLLWAPIWFQFVSNDPSTDRWISKTEQLFLKEKINFIPHLKRRIPWKRILTSKAILALGLGKFLFGFAYVGFMQCLPMYVKDITRTGIEKVGLISALPNLAAIFCVPLAGYILDYVQNKKVFTISQIHKIFLVCGFGLAAIVVSAVGFIQNFIFSVVAFMMFKLIFAFAHVILYAICMYVAPVFSASIVGLTGICLHVGILVTPNFIGYVVEHGTHAEWGIYFKLCGAMHFLAALNFFLFASSEIQSWAVEDSDEVPNQNAEQQEPLKA